MDSEQRIKIIKERLGQAFKPTELKIVDDSIHHIGHAGSVDGAGHYTVIIASDSLKNLKRVDAHKAIYGLLHDLIPKEIHALQIKIL